MHPIASKSFEEDKELLESEIADGDLKDGLGCGVETIAPSFNVSEEHGSESKDRQKYEVESTPATDVRQNYKLNGSWPSSVPNLLSSWLSVTGSCSSSSYLVDFEARHRVRASDLDLDHTPLEHAQMHKRCSESAGRKISRYSTSDSYQNAAPIEKERTNENLSSILWRAVGRHIDKLSDTDMQLAGLI